MAVAGSLGLASAALEAEEDDVRGINTKAQLAEAEAVLQRGKRLDESGHGLGLSIANDLALATGAVLSLDRSPELGGLRATLRWPAPGQA